MAFGFTNSDAESEQALIFAENGVGAIQKQLAQQRARPSATFCKDVDCGDGDPAQIPEERRIAVPGVQYCVHCAPKHHKAPQKIKMLDRIL